MRYRFETIIVAACVLAHVAAVGSRAAETPYESKITNKLHVVYLTHAGREPRADYAARIDRIMKDIQAFYRDEMKRNGYGPMTFPLDLDKSGNVVVHLIRLDRPYPKSGKTDSKYLKASVLAYFDKLGIDMSKSYFIAFQNAYRKDGDKEVYNTMYTGWGGPARGAVWCVDHELLDIANLAPGKNTMINDRGQKLRANQFCVKMIGGAAHELGHGLGLPHNREAKADFKVRGRALMGAGNYTYRNERIKAGKGAHLTPAHAMALSSHPLFKRSEKDRFLLPTCEIRDLQFTRTNKALDLAGEVQGTAPIYGLVVYNDELPTGINKDYDAATYCTRVKPDGTFAIRVDRLRKGTFALHLCFYFTNGTHRKFSFTYDIDAKLTPDLAALNQGLAWIIIERAFRECDYATWQKQAPLLTKEHPHYNQAQVYGRLLRKWSALKSPAEIPTETRKVVLSDTRHCLANVGWLIPGINEILGNNGQKIQNLATTSGRKAKGLYGHAYSRYVYDLGGKWKGITAGCGLQKKHPGSVVFVIKGDGRELFRSDMVTAAADVTAKADLTGVRQLELIIEDGGNGRDSDWGIWFNPVLTR